MRAIYVILILGLLVVSCDRQDVKISDCEKAGGSLDQKNRECLGVSESECRSIGGTFDECASACRNDPDAEMCTLQCVQVCYLDKQLVGNDRDEHGCIPSAGYTWCEEKQKCLREWEEACVSDEIYACSQDSDCIPMPYACHPIECVNKDAAKSIPAVDVDCTEEALAWAAYLPEDCMCQEGRCLNRNIGLLPETPPGTVTNSYDFNSCVADGNPVMESYPRQCIANGITYFEDVGFEEGELIGWEESHERHVCTPEESAATACNMMYAPVCGEIVLNMGKTIYQTFGNACSACASMKTVAYIPGECAEEPEDICYDREGNYLSLDEAADIARNSECGDNLKLECSCDEGFVKNGDACDPICGMSEPPCMVPSFQCENPVICNSYTGTYFIRLDMDKPGCSPTCAVSIATRKAEINWMCTGEMSEPGSAG
jgi:hypothetical protein